MGFFDIFEGVGNFFGDMIGDWLGSEVVGAVVGEVVEGAVVGAITGAAVAAVTGEDIGDGALHGAIIGGITYGVVEGVKQYKAYTPDTALSASAKDTKDVSSVPKKEIVDGSPTETYGINASDVNTERTIPTTTDITNNAILQSPSQPVTKAQDIVKEIVDKAPTTASLEDKIVDLGKQIEKSNEFSWTGPAVAALGQAGSAYATAKSNEALAETEKETTKEQMDYAEQIRKDAIAANQPAPMTGYKMPSFGLESPATFLQNYTDRLNEYKGILA